MSESIKHQVASLPHSPGCYLMKDRLGRVCYVGKAKDLKHRVAQYFAGPARHDVKTRALVEEILSFDVILTRTEVEALLLERTLIKHHQPRFNILLRDDKEFPYVRVHLEEPWPRLEKVRRRKDDGAVYVGPFGGAGRLNLMLTAAHRIFPLVRCTRREFETRKRPCNYYDMKLCMGPCTLPVDRAVYIQAVEDAIAFLRGRNADVTRSLKERMRAAAEAERYELAAVLRDQLEAMNLVAESQSVVAVDIEDADVIGIAMDDRRVSFQAMTVRDGKVVAVDSFVVASPVQDLPGALRDFLLQYYDGRSVPAEVLLPIELPDGEELRLAMRESHPDATRLEFKVPSRGSRADLVAMAQKNAAWRLEETTRLARSGQVELEAIQDRLGLSRTPRRVECIDISNLQGTAIVASDVCFVDGKPAKDLYRHYKIEGVTGSADDFGSIKEVVRRRFARAVRDQDAPDLLVIDGGRGQLSSALEAAREFPELSIDLVGLAKSKLLKDRGRRRHTGVPTETIGENRERSYERVFFPEKELPLALAPGTPEYRLLTRIRDEAHRFAITHHRKSRSRVLQGSALTEVPGIGETLRKKLLATFGGLEGIRKASLAELKAVPGIKESAAVALHGYLRGEEDGEAASEGEVPVTSPS